MTVKRPGIPTGTKISGQSEAAIKLESRGPAGRVHVRE
jgi:hypothetical protein